MEHQGAFEVLSLMKNISRLVMILVLMMFVGGGVFLVTWDIPAPSKKIEKELPDDRFPK
jgi:hypothetical protein